MMKRRQSIMERNEIDAVPDYENDYHSHSEDEPENSSHLADAEESNHSDASIIDETDREVENTIRRRKRKGHGWSRPKGFYSSRSRSRSTFSETSRTTYLSEPCSSITGFISDFTDSEGLLYESGVRTDDEVRNVTSRRRRKRGHGWSRLKGSSRSRSRAYSPSTTYSRASKKTVASTTSYSDARAKKLISETRSKNVRLKNMFNDILSIKGNLRDFTTAYLIQEKACYEFYNSDEEAKQVVPIVKTRYACKMRDEVLQAFKHTVYECSECVACCLEPQQITQHMIELHNRMPVYICPECKLKFVLRDHLEIHKELHDKSFKANCLFCSQEFTHRRVYEEHMDRYLTCLYKCIYCGDFYTEQYNYRSHVRKRHKGLRFHLRKESFSYIQSRCDYDKPDLLNNGPNNNEFVRVLIQTPNFQITYINSPIVEEGS